MPARNQAWYDSNANRAYPVDDRATLVTDAGVLLPSGIITDLNLRFPDTVGNRAFLSSVTVTERIVTVTILAFPDTNENQLTAIASVSLPKPIIKGRHYPLEAQYPGVGGWIVFGIGIDETFQGRFLTPDQSLLLPRSARSYRPFPISSVAKVGAPNLTGIVRLSGGEDFEIVKECREVPVEQPTLGCDDNNRLARQAVVFRLKDSTTIGAGRNVYDIYKGACNTRPESRTCTGSDPIEFINSVGPDCCNNITIEFAGCAVVTPFRDDYKGVVVDCDISLGDACLRQARLPEADGKLPNEYEDECSDHSEIIEIPDPPDVPDPPSYVPPDEPESTDPGSLELPYFDNFDDNVAQNFEVKVGSFGFDPLDDSPSELSWMIDSFGVSYTAPGSSYMATNIAVENVSILPGGTGWSSINKRLITDFKIATGEAGASHNARVFINHKFSASSVIRGVGYIAEADIDNKRIRLLYYNGYNANPVASFAVSSLNVETWYRMSVTVAQDVLGVIYIGMSVVGLQDGTNVSISPIPANNFGDASGNFGLGSSRSVTKFGSVYIDHEVTP